MAGLETLRKSPVSVLHDKARSRNLLASIERDVR